MGAIDSTWHGGGSDKVISCQILEVAGGDFAMAYRWRDSRKMEIGSSEGSGAGCGCGLPVVVMFKGCVHILASYSNLNEWKFILLHIHNTSCLSKKIFLIPLEFPFVNEIFQIMIQQNLLAMT